MSQPLLIAFVVFATVMFFTPGPNNIMLLSSGLTYGFRPTLPHIAGITFGFAFMVGAVGLGLGAVFISYPVLQTVLKYVRQARRRRNQRSRLTNPLNKASSAAISYH
jgi:threonine/homoserine/homoserine lactone efflux protein